MNDIYLLLLRVVLSQDPVLEGSSLGFGSHLCNANYMMSSCGCTGGIFSDGVYSREFPVIVVVV